MLVVSFVLVNKLLGVFCSIFGMTCQSLLATEYVREVDLEEFVDEGGNGVWAEGVREV